MEFEIKIDAIDLDIFFQHLNNNLLKIAGKINIQSVPIDYYTEHSIKVIFPSKNGRTIRLFFKICRDKDKIIDPITITAPDGENETDWQDTIVNIINNSIKETKTHQITVSTCHLFGYIGPILDGEYSFSDFRLVPAPEQNKLFGSMPDNIERIIYLYLETEEKTHQVAIEHARIKAKRYASLLSLFLGIGLYEYDHYDLTSNLRYTKENKKFHWSYIPKSNGEYTCVSVQRGYDFLPILYASSPGSYRSIDRSKIDNLTYQSGDNLKCPNDIVNLFNAVHQLPDNIKSKFYGAAALFQFAAFHKLEYPSVALSYAVSAIDAITLKSKKKKVKKALICTQCNKSFIKTQNKSESIKEKINRIITQCFPDTSENLISFLYNGIRCSQFHEGKFPAGEFDIQLFNPFAAIDNSIETLEIQNGYNILRSSLIKWLLIQ